MSEYIQNLILNDPPSLNDIDNLHNTLTSLLFAGLPEAEQSEGLYDILSQYGTRKVCQYKFKRYVCISYLILIYTDFYFAFIYYIDFLF